MDDGSLLDQIQVTGGKKRDASNRWTMARCCINTSNGRGRRKQATGGEQKASKGWRDARTEFEFRPTCLARTPCTPAIAPNIPAFAKSAKVNLNMLYKKPILFII